MKSAKPFPHIYKFKHYIRKKQREKLQNTLQLIKSSKSKKDFYGKIANITQRDIKKIESRTRGQSVNDNWFFYRQGLVTATLTKRIHNTVKKGKNYETRIGQ